MSAFVIVLIGFTLWQTRADSVWQEPNAWERHSPSASLPNSCPVCDVAEESVLAAFYYRKLITNLFNKNTLEKNEQTGQLQRAVLFSLSPAQLEILERSSDIRDLDAVVTAILVSARTPARTQSKESRSFLWLLIDILKDFFQILKIILGHSEARFGFFVLGVVLLIWFIRKRYKKSFVFIVGCGFLLIGYTFTYLECNRQLKVEELVSFIKENSPEETNWLQKTFKSVFGKSKRDEQIAKIKNQTKIKLPFCRPDQVLVMYVNELFFNQLQLIIEKCTEMVIHVNGKVPWPYNIGAMIAVPILYFFIMKFSFKYIVNPSVWYKILRDKTRKRQQEQDESSHGDRLTGANLKIFLEAFASKSADQKKEPPPSGVEEIKEPPGDATPEKESNEAISDEQTSDFAIEKERCENDSILEKGKSKKES